ncbi:ribonuclease H-like domain-containing protein [Tanacetum coccineum]
MVTRFRIGDKHPTKRLTLHVSSISPLSKSYHDVFNDPNWQNTISNEYNALIKNNTWTRVPRPTDANIVHCMCLFRYEYLADGSLSHYKARLVANGGTQIEGIDVDKTFSPLDAKNAFLNDDLSETVYMHQPPRFRDSTHLDYGTHTAYLLLYVDDIVLAASSKILLQPIIASLHQEFFMTDLSPLNYFLGIFVTRDSLGMFLSQRQYPTEILERAHMVGCISSRIPVDTESKLGDDGHPVCLYMHDHREPHLSALKRILRGIVSWDNVRVLHVPSCYQYADIFTKGLSSALFEEFRSSLSIRCPSAPTAKEC